MRTRNLFIALIVFVLPVLATLFWFYSGISKTNSTSMPDFSEIDLPLPPISTSVALTVPPKAATSLVLVDMKHGNLVTLSEIDPLLRNIESMGGAIEDFREDGDLAANLKSATTFLSAVPMSSYTSEELQAVVDFVARGGRLVVVTDPTRNTFFSESGTMGLSGVDAANQILEPFDLSFRDDYLYNLVKNEGNYRNVIVTDISSHSLMKDIKQLVIYGGHSINPNGTPLAFVNDGTISSANEQTTHLSPVVIANYGKGQVLAIGDISFMTAQYVQSADNQIFVRNLAKFLTETNREKTLAEFPFLFKGKVVVQPTGDIKIDGELLSTISSLEKVITQKPGTLTISKDVSKNVDRILLTTFKSNKETKEILDFLDIDLAPEPSASEETGEPVEIALPQENTPTPAPTTFPEVRETDIPLFDVPLPAGSPDEISIPGMGIVKTGGLGVVGLVNEKDRSTLVIMAATPDKIQELLNQITTENLKNCLIHNDLAACRISGNTIVPAG